jgi:hypothetical protein
VKMVGGTGQETGQRTWASNVGQHHPHPSGSLDEGGQCSLQIEGGAEPRQVAHTSYHLQAKVRQGESSESLCDLG